mgnify:CR=1 FL=1
MDITQIDEQTLKQAKNLISRVLSTTVDNPDNPDSLNFFQADTYRFYFLMSFMWEYFDNNEISFYLFVALNQFCVHGFIYLVNLSFG